MTTYHVIVLLEWPDDENHHHHYHHGRVLYRTWRGPSPAAIHRAARTKYALDYPGARLSFGNARAVNYYGAH